MNSINSLREVMSNSHYFSNWHDFCGS